MNLKTRIRMTASEIAMGRYMRAPDHPTGGEGDGDAPAGGGEAASAPAPAETAPTPDSDDFAAFEGAADKNSFGEVDSPAPGADPDDKSGSEADDGGENQPPEGEEKKGKSAQERIDELTATAREAERRAAEADRILNDPKELRKRLGLDDDGAKDEGPRTTEDGRELLEGEPNPDDYEYGEADSSYIKDSATFHARVEFQRQEAKKALEAEFTAIDTTYQERVEKAAARYPDFEEKVVKGAQGENPTWKASPVMALAMKTSEEGPDVAYYLATNPGESERIAKLSPLEQAREMGRLEGKFAFGGERKQEPAPVSKAPKPPTDLARGDGGKFTVAADTDDFAAFDKAHS